MPGSTDPQLVPPRIVPHATVGLVPTGGLKFLSVFEPLRRSMRKHLVVLVSFVPLVLGMSAGAQDLAKSTAPISGAVLRSDGSAWSEAAVVLNSSSWRLPPSSPFVHQVDTSADREGTFRSDIVLGRRYSAWAVSKVEDGRYTVTDVVEGASVGMSLQLQEDKNVQRVVAVEVLGLDAWGKEGPFSFEVECFINDRFVVNCKLDDAGRALIPPMPDEARFLVRSAAGAVIASGMIPLGRKERRRSAEGEAGPRSAATALGGTSFATVSEELTRVTVSPPVLLRFDVRGPRGPVRGARLFWFERSDRRVLAETNKKGQAELPVPSDWSDRGPQVLRHVELWVEAPECAAVKWFVDDLDVLDEDGNPRVHSITLLKGHSISGRLSLSGRNPAASAPILVHTGTPPRGPAGPGDFRGNENTASAAFDGTPRIFWTDAKGNFEVVGMAPNIAWQLSTLLGPEASFLGTSEFPLAPAVLLASGEDSTKKKLKLGSLTLSSFRPIDVTVTGAQSAAGVIADLAYRDELAAVIQEENVASVRSGPGGRIRLLGRPKSRILVSVQENDAQERAIDVKPSKKPLETALSAKSR